MPYAANGTQRIFYEDTGGDLPAIAFSHGLFMDRTMFAPQVEALRDRYRCIVWDERGHGKTAGDAPPPFTYYDSAEDLVAVLRHAGVQRAVLAGMSQGGFLSLRCTLRHPEIVRALILIDTQAGLEEPDAKRQFTAMAEDWAQNGLGEQNARSLAHNIIGVNYTDADVWIAKWRKMTAPNVLAAVQTLIRRDDISEAIRAITAPALVIHGDRDLSIDIERAEAMRKALKNAAPMVVIPGAGHASNLTHPGPVNRAIETFLAGLGEDGG